jgi:hypothetical protein
MTMRSSMRGLAATLFLAGPLLGSGYLLSAGGCVGDCIPGASCPCPSGSYGTSACGADGESRCDCCLLSGQACEPGDSCCNGTSCIEGVCSACTFAGGFCQGDGECCDGTVCCNNTCGAAGCCGSYGSFCTDSAECCAGLSCAAGWHHDGFADSAQCVNTTAPECEHTGEGGAAAEGCSASFLYCTDVRERVIRCAPSGGIIECVCEAGGMVEATFPYPHGAGGGGSGGDGGSGGSGGGGEGPLDCVSLAGLCGFTVYGP